MKITINFIFILIGMAASNIISYYYLCECITLWPMCFIGSCICISAIIDYFILNDDTKNNGDKK